MRRCEASGGRVGWLWQPEIVAADPTRLALLAELPVRGRYYRGLLSGHMR